MPLVPNLMERTLFFTLNQAPAPMLDLFGMLAFRTVVAGVRLHIFDTLSEGPLTATEVAAKIAAEARGVAILLNALEGTGYVTRSGDRYANTAMTTKWLTRGSPSNFAPGFEFWATSMAEIWNNLEESVKTGQPAHSFYDWIEGQPETSRNFQEYMIAITNTVAGEITGKIKILPTARRLLDVGGGHGAYSIALARKYPGLTATIMDSPQAIRTARENIEREQMGERVTVQEGNIFTDDMGSGYDVALVFNIIHAFDAPRNTELFGRVASALKPGGLIVVAEQIAGKASSPTARATNAIFGLNYFHLFGGSVYSYEDIAGWLIKAGYMSVQRTNIMRAPGNSLIFGTKAP